MPVDHPLKISIVTPSYKQLSWLKLCAASIADQQGVTVEYIIQDACSGPELEEWVRKNTSAQLVVERDKNMYDAVNRGLRRATGDICAYLNCDEQYLPGTLRRVADYFEQHPEVDVLFGDSIIVDPSLMPLAYRLVVLPWRLHTLLCPMNVLTCSTFFRRKIVDDGVFFDTAWKNFGDKSWLLSLFDRGYRMAVLQEPLAIFTLTGTNMSQQQDVRAEHVRWRKDISPAILMTRPLVLAAHFLKKWKQGAYASRPIHSAWYTPDSLPVRRSFAESTLGWKWPVLASKDS